MQQVVLVWTLCTLVAGAHASLESTSPKPIQVSKQLPEAENIGKSLPDSTPVILDKTAGLDPEQIHLTYWGTPDKMAVTFASGNGQTVMGPPPAGPLKATTAALAQWGVSKDKLSRNASCITSGYVQNQYPHLQSPSYVSPYLTTCIMTGLPTNSLIWYRVGWPEFDSWSSPANFKTFKAKDNFPFKVGVMADLGLSTHTLDVLQTLLKSGPQVVLNIGDLPYADNYLPNGKEGTIKQFKYLLSFQPRWDMFGRMMQGLAAHVPVMTSTGNHEIEFQPDGTVFAAYNTRYPVPQDKTKAKPFPNKFTKKNPSPDNNLYYSWDVPGTAHFIALTSYIPNDTFTVNTAQYKWLEADLKKFDRKATPWLIVYFHAPFVSSYEASFKQVECMRLTYEPLLYKYGTNLILNGHVHAYERFYNNYNYTLDRCGPVHITIGCGGKPGEPGSGVAALDTKYIEEGSFYCKDPSVLNLKPNIAQPIRCTSYQPSLGGFCWNRQPDFSAYREPTFGAASLKLLNATHADWKFYRTSEKTKQGYEVADGVIINRLDQKGCPNHAFL